MQIEDLVECLGIKNPDTRTKAEVERDAALGKFILLTELFAYDLMIMEMLKKGGFDPNQPRVPAGNHDGGQWTDGDGESDYPDAIEEDHTIDALFGIGGAIRAAGVRISSAIAGKISTRIANGHAYDKHVIRNSEFPGIRTREEFGDFIKNIIRNPSDVKELRNGRKGFWDDSTKTVIIIDKNNPDGGTAFKPKTGKNFFDIDLD